MRGEGEPLLQISCILGDDAKSESNLRKHGVGLSSAQLVFDDPLHVSRQDRVENGEQRWQTVGLAGGVVALLVAHTWFEEEGGIDHLRIISARRATRLERKIYEQAT